MLCLMDKLRLNVVFDFLNWQKMHDPCFLKRCILIWHVFEGEMSYLRASRLEFALEDEMSLSIGV